MDGTFTAVVDRVVDGATAVVLVEDDGEVIEQVTVPVENLPAATQDEGGHLSVTIRDGDIVSMTDEAEETGERDESIREKLDRLSKRLSEE